MSHFFLSQMDDEPFNPDYVEVDRVLDVSESTDENGEVCLHAIMSVESLGTATLKLNPIVCVCVCSQ